jgi:peptide/nickel transport system permease protein
MTGIWNYLRWRLLLTILTLAVLSLVVFLMIRLVPGDPAVAILGPRATEESLKLLREALGLDLPLHQQYWRWLSRLMRGDLGRSIRSNAPVGQELRERLQATVELAFTSFLLATLAGIPLGALAATRHHSHLDRGSMALAIVGQSVPIFVTGLLLIYIFSFKLNWLPFSGRLDAGIHLERISGFYIIDSIITRNTRALRDALAHLVLPSAALATLNLALVARITRSGMLEVLHQDYIRTARAKGLPERLVIYRHALRNALIPLVTVLGLQLGVLMGGAVLTESVFAWPGLGLFMVDAVLNRDYPVLQGAVLVTGLLFMMINLIVDVLYILIDPRIRYE